MSIRLPALKLKLNEAERGKYFKYFSSVKYYSSKLGFLVRYISAHICKLTKKNETYWSLLILFLRCIKVFGELWKTEIVITKNFLTCTFILNLGLNLEDIQCKNAQKSGLWSVIVIFCFVLDMYLLLRKVIRNIYCNSNDPENFKYVLLLKRNAKRRTV